MVLNIAVNVLTTKNAFKLLWMYHHKKWFYHLNSCDKNMRILTLYHSRLWKWLQLQAWKCSFCVSAMINKISVDMWYHETIFKRWKQKCKAEWHVAQQIYLLYNFAFKIKLIDMKCDIVIYELLVARCMWHAARRHYNSCVVSNNESRHMLLCAWNSWFWHTFCSLLQPRKFIYLSSFNSKLNWQKSDNLQIIFIMLFFYHFVPGLHCY